MSTLELFFDLVFVFTVTQVATIVVDAPTGAGVGQAALELSIIFWMYGGYAWLTNTSEPNTPARRAVLLAAMAAFLTCSLAVPTAFHSGGVPFGVGYVVVNLVHAGGFLVYRGRAALPSVRRLLPWNLLSAGLVLAAGWAHGTVVWVLWAVAVAVQLLTPFLTRVGEGFAINAAHFAERHGLVILIVLGESLVSVAVAGQHQQFQARLVLGALAGLLTATVMWWMYFGGDDDRASAALDDAAPNRRPVLAIVGYFFAHFPMIFGILLVAAGARLSVHNLASPASTASAWLVACGAGAFALGSSAFRLALRFAPPLPRALGAVACLAAVPVGLAASTAAELVTVAVILGATLLVEAWSPRLSRRPRPQPTR